MMNFEGFCSMALLRKFARMINLLIESQEAMAKVAEEAEMCNLL
jgi:hypothetical protein